MGFSPDGSFSPGRPWSVKPLRTTTAMPAICIKVRLSPSTSHATPEDTTGWAVRTVPTVPGPARATDAISSRIPTALAATAMPRTNHLESGRSMGPIPEAGSIRAAAEASEPHADGHRRKTGQGGPPTADTPPMHAAEPNPAAMPIGSALSHVQVWVARETPKQTMPAAAHARRGTGTLLLHLRPDEHGGNHDERERGRGSRAETGKAHVIHHRCGHDAHPQKHEGSKVAPAGARPPCTNQ